MRIATARGLRTMQLQVSNAFHSRFMEEAACNLAEDAPIPDTLPASLDGRVALYRRLELVTLGGAGRTGALRPVAPGDRRTA